jgi:hypothetical protein
MSRLAAAATGEPSLTPEDAADLLVVASVLHRPPHELRVVRMRAVDILAA